MSRSGGKSITLADVAREAGYSKSTASLVFQDSPLVAQGTRERVVAAAEQLGYVYNRRAAGLRMQRSNTIGLLIAGLANPFFGDLTESIEEALAPSGYTLLLGNTLEDPARQQALITTLLEFRVDGLLVIPANGSPKAFVDQIIRMRTPHVVLTRRATGASAPYVGSDDERAGRIAAQHLVEHGCRRIAYFGAPENAFTRVEREAGVFEVCREAGIELDAAWSVRTRTSSSAGYAAAAALLESSPPPEGIVCHSDAVAFGVMRALHDAGHRIGDGVRVVGFDDVEHAANWSPSLTSVSVNARRMGQVAARMLLERIADPTLGNETLVFQPELRVRESCGAHPH